MEGGTQSQKSISSHNTHCTSRIISLHPWKALKADFEQKWAAGIRSSFRPLYLGKVPSRLLLINHPTFADAHSVSLLAGVVNWSQKQPGFLLRGAQFIKRAYKVQAVRGKLRNSEKGWVPSPTSLHGKGTGRFPAHPRVREASYNRPCLIRAEFSSGTCSKMFRGFKLSFSPQWSETAIMSANKWTLHICKTNTNAVFVFQRKL